MARYDRRFLIFTSLQISPAWAMYHHSTSDWLHTVYVRIHPILNKFHIYYYKFSEIRNYIFPREILLYMGLAMLASYCFFVSTFIGIKKFTNYMRFCFHNTKNHKNKNILSKVRVRVQKKFMNSRIKSKIKNKRFGNRRSVYTNVKRVACLETDSFDGDSTDLGVGATWCVLDNSANSHIWNKESDFVPGSIRALNEMSSVATIGGNNFYPTGIGDLNVKIKDDENKISAITLKNVLYFPNSPVNIISVVCLADHFDDDYGTSVLTTRNSSTFTWNKQKYTKSLGHSRNRLPEIMVNEGSSSEINCKIRNLVPASDFNTYNSEMPEEELDKNAAIIDAETMATYFTKSDSEDDNDRLRTNKDKEYGSALKERLISAEHYKIGDTVKYCKDGHNELATYEDLEIDDIDVPPKYILRLHDSEKEIRTHKEFVFPIDVPDICDTNLSENQVKTILNDLTGKEIQKLFSRNDHDELYSEFMAWHERLNHLPIPEMFKLCEKGELPQKFLNLKTKTIICPSCIIGNMKRKPWRYKNGQSNIRKEDEDFSGACVSVDQLVSKQPGLVPRQDGKHSLARITGATIYMDHHSNWIYSQFQTSLDGEQTCASKVAFEAKASTYGVSIKSFHADNGRFAEKSFKDEVYKANQTIKYCAVGAHHQNGIIERKIGTMSSATRILLMHAMRNWPEMISNVLWPYAWKEVERRMNLYGFNKHGEHPENTFGNLKYTSNLKDQHTWGCPVFVLSAKARELKIPKWDPRARVGVYLGHSPSHAGTVALVLNPITLHVSPQYHVIFDDNYSTVPYLRRSEKPPNWTDLCIKSRTIATTEDFDEATKWAKNSIDIRTEDETFLHSFNKENDSIATSVQETVSTNLSEASTNVSEGDNEESNRDKTKNIQFQEPLIINEAEITSSEGDREKEKLSISNLDQLSRRRSKRSAKPTEKIKQTYDKKIKKSFGLFTVFSLVCATTVSGMKALKPISMAQRIVLHAERLSIMHDGSTNTINQVYASMTGSDNGVYTLREMIKQDDRADFIAAMLVEIHDHEERNHWTMIPRNMLPEGAKTIMSVWSFKRKRLPDGEILKHKARLCAHGGMQTWGENYWETYAPVVNWLSVRIILIISILHDLDTRAMDFVLAFPQADLDEDVYMELPYGFEAMNGENKEYVLKLNKSLYGLKQAAHNWFQTLDGALQNRNFKSSNIDQCVYFRSDCIVLVYVDDCIIISKKNTKVADTLIESMRTGTEQFKLEDLGTMDRFLGVDIKENKNGTIELSQPHLITRFIELINIEENEHSKDTPAMKSLLHKDTDGTDRMTEWNYRTAV